MTENDYLLLIDDEPDILEAYKIMLEENGYPVLLAADKNEALKVLEEYTIAVCLVDLKLKDEDGLQVSRELYQVDPLIKIIIITAYPTYETAVDAMKMGIFDYVSKTEDPRVLLKKIENALDVRDAEISKKSNLSLSLKNNIVMVCGHGLIQGGIENFCRENPSYKLVKTFRSCSYIKPGDFDANAALLLLCKSCFNPKQSIEMETLFDRLHTLFPNAGFAMIDGSFNDEEKYEFLQYGVRGFIEDTGKESMKKAFDLVIKGQLWVSQEISHRLLIELLEKSRKWAFKKKEDIYHLSKRETEIFQAMASGLSNIEIGDKFYISENTVKIHINHIFRKLAVKSRTQAVVKAKEAGII
jgi:DNA-binding NarL/FixJ family response regulator